MVAVGGGGLDVGTVMLYAKATRVQESRVE
jgi:hypothetical protein